MPERMETIDQMLKSFREKKIETVEHVELMLVNFIRKDKSEMTLEIVCRTPIKTDLKCWNVHHATRRDRANR